MLDFSRVDFRYEPFPIGFATNVLNSDTYLELVESFPPITSLKQHKEAYGNKYYLSEWNDPSEYNRCVSATPAWRAFYDHIKSEEFSRTIIKTLLDANIDFGFQSLEIANDNAFDSTARRYANKARRKLMDFNPLVKHPPGRLSSRFEFSALPAQGGSVSPHTDQPRKVMSLVLNMAKDGEWDPAWGGGTSLCRPKDPRNYVNHNNRYLSFDDVEFTHDFPFLPNSCVIFVKTFNSWHAVKPIQGGNSDLLRKNLVINIDYTPRY